MDQEKIERSKEVALYVMLLILAALSVPVSYCRYKAIYQPTACAESRPECGVWYNVSD